MTITLPWRRITLHLSHMGLTLGLTFMVRVLFRSLASCTEWILGPFLTRLDNPDYL